MHARGIQIQVSLLKRWMGGKKCPASFQFPQPGAAPDLRTLIAQSLPGAISHSCWHERQRAETPSHLGIRRSSRVTDLLILHVQCNILCAGYSKSPMNLGAINHCHFYTTESEAVCGASQHGCTHTVQCKAFCEPLCGCSL